MKVKNETAAQRRIRIHNEYGENQRRHEHKAFAQHRTTKRRMTRQSRRANRG